MKTPIIVFNKKTINYIWNIPEIDKLDTRSTTMKDYFTFIANFFTASLICLFCRSPISLRLLTILLVSQKFSLSMKRNHRSFIEKLINSLKWTPKSYFREYLLGVFIYDFPNFSGD